MTGLPWKQTDSNKAGDIYIGSDEHHHFIIVENSPLAGGDAQSKADLILLACNAHKDLLAACKAMLVVTDKGEKPRKLDEALTWQQNDELAYGMAKAAITKGTVDGPAQRPAPYGQPETFQSLCDKSKTPMPLGGEKNETV